MVDGTSSGCATLTWLGILLTPRNVTWSSLWQTPLLQLNQGSCSTWDPPSWPTTMWLGWTCVPRWWASSVENFGGVSRSQSLCADLFMDNVLTTFLPTILLISHVSKVFRKEHPDMVMMVCLTVNLVRPLCKFTWCLDQQFARYPKNSLFTFTLQMLLSTLSGFVCWDNCAWDLRFTKQ